MTITDIPVGAPTTPTALEAVMDGITRDVHTQMHDLETKVRSLAAERDDAKADAQRVQLLLEDEQSLSMVLRNMVTTETVRAVKAEGDLAQALADLQLARVNARAARDGAFRHKSEADRLSERCRDLAEALDDARTQIATLTAAQPRCQPRRRFGRKGRHL